MDQQPNSLINGNTQESIRPVVVRGKCLSLTTIYTQQKSSGLDTYKISIYTKMLHMRQIKSLLCEASECPLHFDTKLEGTG